MEYGISIDNSSRDLSYVRHVGYQESNDCIRSFFNPSTVKTISSKVTQLLQGVDPYNRPIIVPDKTIANVMDSVYNNFRPETGDMYARYNIPGNSEDNYIQKMIDETIEIIVSDVKNNIGMEECNRKLSVWTTVLGDFNDKGLRSHPQIKLRKKRPTPMQFNMNY